MLNLKTRRLARFRWLFAVAVVGAAVGITAGFLLRGGGTSDLVRGSLTIRTADAAAGPRLTSDQAETIARKALAGHMANTIRGLALVSGRDIGVDDLVKVEAEFAPTAVEIKSSVSTFHYSRGSEPASLWVFAYRAAGVTMPEWGIIDGVVEATAIVNDTTGEIESMDVLQTGPKDAPVQ